MLNIGAAKATKPDRFIEHCVHESIIAPEEVEWFNACGKPDVGCVAIVVSRIAGSDLYPVSAYDKNAEVIPMTEMDFHVMKQAYYEWAVDKGIIPEAEDIESPVTREQFAVILNNLTTYLQIEADIKDDVLEDYEDADSISEEALEAMKFVYTNELLDPGEVTLPDSEITEVEFFKAIRDYDKHVDTGVARPSGDSGANNTDTQSAKPKTSIFLTVSKSLGEGFLLTFALFAVTLLLALPLGLILSFASMSRFKPLKWLVKTLIWVIRGTPLMLQLIVIFYGPALLGWCVMDRFFAAALAFIINYSCYFSEIFRGGIESISKGQYEAGQVLGMTKLQVFFRVILLQVVKRVLAPMSNEIITLVKDTSLARTIAVYELIYQGQAFIKSHGLIWPLFYTGAFYLVFNGLLTVLFGKLEKKLDYFRG